VAGDTRALFAERLLGNLHHDFLAGLQHFADELRPARAVAVAVMAVTAMLAMATAAGAAAIEATSPASAITTAVAAAISAPFGASAPAAVSAAASERPLETGTGIAANTRRLARKFALGFLAGVRRPGFTRQEESVFGGS
jgi:hypothetical protein